MAVFENFKFFESLLESKFELVKLPGSLHPSPSTHELFNVLKIKQIFTKNMPLKNVILFWSRKFFCSYDLFEINLQHRTKIYRVPGPESLTKQRRFFSTKKEGQNFFSGKFFQKPGLGARCKGEGRSKESIFSCEKKNTIN